MLRPRFAFACTAFLASSFALAGPTVDHHQHLVNAAMAERLVAAGNPLPALVEADDIIKLLDAAGIERAVVLSVAYQLGRPSRPVVDEPGKVRAENDYTSAQVAKYPKRLTGFCGVNPLKEYALDEIARCARDPNLKTGLKMHFGNSDVQLDRAEDLAQMQRVFKLANANKMALAVHMRASISLKRPYGPQQAKIFLEHLMPLVPDVTVQVAHMAGAGPGYDDTLADSVMDTLAEAAGKGAPHTANLYFDVASMADLNISPANAATLVKRIRQAGVGRFLYGTDAALYDNLRPRESWASFRKLPLSAAEFDKIEKNVAPYLRQP
jgi:predicted TIM-barrel fold metal-dependent hydrolase